MRVMRLVFEKKTIFFNDVYSGKKLFLKIWFFSSVFISNFFLKCIYFTFESCLSLIMASGSQLKVKTISYIYHINSSCQVFYYKYTVLFKYVI